LKFLIITADDFGLHEAVNRAVEQAARDGVLTTTSLMVGAPAAAGAVRLARELPALSVGLHLVLADGWSVLPPRRIPALVDAQGRFGNNMVRDGVRFFALPAVRRQLEAEIRAQFQATMQKLEEAKAAPVHLRIEDFRLVDGKPFNEITPTRIRFLANSTFEAAVKVAEPGVYVFTVSASCDAAHGEFAKFNFSVDGAVVTTVKLTGENPRDYEVSARLAAGQRRVAIAFLNDWYVESPREDRNLYVHDVSYRKAK